MKTRRRELIQLALSGVAACCTIRAASATSALDKMTREQAKYQDFPQGIYTCAICSLFEPPQSCKVVEGEISKDGWCRAFALAD
jgi:hypothetical protein